MKRHRKLRRLAKRAAAVTAVAVGALGMGSAAAAQDAGSLSSLDIVTVDTSAHPDVTLTVTLPQALAGTPLGADEFTITENGQVVDVAVTPVSNETLQVVLVVDTSGSMQGEPLAAAQAAATAFVDSLPAGAQVAVVGFGGEPYVASPLGADPQDARASISTLGASGETALYDALVLGSQQFVQAEGARHALVVLSDGGDTVSAATLDEAKATIGGAALEFAAVALVTPEFDGSSLDSLAAAAGGPVVSADDPAQLTAAYAAIATNLTNRYALTYTTLAGGTTQVVVGVQSPAGAASAERTIQLAQVEGTGAVAAPPAPVVNGTPGFIGSDGALYAGLGAFFAALVAIGVVVFRPRERTIRLGGMLRQALPDRIGMDRLADRSTAFAERFLRRHGSESRLNSALEQAGIDLRAGEYVVLAGASTVAVLAVGFLLSGPLGAVGLAGLTIVAFRLYVTFKAARRKAAFAEQLADTLQMIAGNLRAGHGVLQAIDSLSHEAPSPTAEEFRRVVAEVRLGRDLGEALRAMASRIGNPDTDWFVQAIEINREVGGDLAQILDTVAETIRERQRLHRQVKALSSEGRMSAAVLMGLPFAVAGMVSMTSPDYIGELFTTGIGIGMLVLSGVLMITGGIWMKRTVKVTL